LALSDFLWQKKLREIINNKHPQTDKLELKFLTIVETVLLFEDLLLDEENNNKDMQGN
jgi:hypothetical protein